MRRGRAAGALLLLGALGFASAQAETRAYRGLWGGLFHQQASSGLASSAAAAEDRLRQALADAAALFRPHTASAGDAGGAAGEEPAQRSTLLPHHSPLVEALLDRLAAHPLLSNSSLLAGSALSSGLPADRLRGLDAEQLAATLATLQAVALAGLLSGGGGGGGGGLRAPGSGLDSLGFFRQVEDPSWDAFRPHTCLRLQDFGNAEGYSAALLGPAPCTTSAAAAPAARAAAVSSDALRWGSQAAFTLDCSRVAAASEGSTSGGSAGTAAGEGTLSGALHAAASAAAASVAAAWDRSASCRLSVSSDSGSGALLEHAFERPVLGGPKLDALRVRVCNQPPSTAQFPAALARGGAAVSLASLKLNGRPLLVTPLGVTQSAAASEGCLLALYRLPSRATRGGYVLTGMVRMDDGSASAGASGDGLGGPSGASAGFGVGEMASVEVTLGQYSRLGAATSRLLGGATSGSGAAGGTSAGRR